MLTTSYAINYLDRYVLSILAVPVKAEFGISDAAMGLLLGIRSKREPTGALTLDCPACKNIVSADSYTHIEQLGCFTRFPLRPGASPTG